MAVETAAERDDQTDYDRQLAAEIVAMLPNVREDAWRVLRLVVAILLLEPLLLSAAGRPNPVA
jgi:hypothetical protein